MAFGVAGAVSPAVVPARSVPDEAALTQYVPLAATATGPAVVVAPPIVPATPQPLPAQAEGQLRGLPPERAAKLRDVATSTALGAPSAAAERTRRPLIGRAAAPSEPSLPSAVGQALGDAGAGALLLTLLLGGCLGAAAALAAGRSRQRLEQEPAG